MLPDLRVASPCTASWEQMTGDDRVRHCAECNLDVYNFSALTPAEIEQLLAASKGQRLCGRLYRRADGTVLTRDCPVGFRARVRRVSNRIGVALAAAMSVTFASAQSAHQNTPSLVQIAPATARAEIVVYDASGAVIPRTKIEIWSSAKLIAEGAADASGRFTANLAPGTYNVTAIPFVVGFKTGHARLSVSDQPVTLPLTLEVGGSMMMGFVVDVTEHAVSPNLSTVTNFLPEPASLKPTLPPPISQK